MSKIMLDPGHGYNNTGNDAFDPGAVAVVGSIVVKEATLALVIAGIVRLALIELGHEVRLTRESDTEPCTLGSRAKKATNWGAPWMVSLHQNADDSPRANGWEAWYQSPREKIMADAIREQVIRETPFRDRGSKKTDRFAVVMAAGDQVLLENGFLTSPIDMEWLMRAGSLDRLGRAIAAGIELGMGRV